MADEKRLIDADAFRNLLQQVVYDVFTVHEHNGELTGTASVGYYTETIEEVLKQTPTVDAVEVVRCKDCRYYDKDALWCNISSPIFYPEHYNWYEEDFCSYGERRTDDRETG